MLIQADVSKRVTAVQKEASRSKEQSALGTDARRRILRERCGVDLQRIQTASQLIGAPGSGGAVKVGLTSR